MGIRVIVCGSRSWTDKKAIFRRLEKLPDNTVIVHGNCKTGADRLADECAKLLHFEIEKHDADWKQFERAAGPIRNEKMAKLGARLCLAFWDGTSTGTKTMINAAITHNISVETHFPDGKVLKTKKGKKNE